MGRRSSWSSCHRAFIGSPSATAPSSTRTSPPSTGRAGPEAESGDLEREARVGAAKRLLDLLRCIAAREDEAEVLPTLRSGADLLTPGRGDRDLLATRHGL